MDTSGLRVCGMVASGEGEPALATAAAAAAPAAATVLATRIDGDTALMVEGDDTVLTAPAPEAAVLVVVAAPPTLRARGRAVGAATLREPSASSGSP